jgi:probable phosphoglycerate mutase
MSLKIFFLRHGQTEFSRDNAFCGADLNPELTADGNAMAKAFAHGYKSTEWRAIFVSPLKRTIATAKPLCDALGAKMELREDLVEIRYGKWEGKSIAEVSRDYHDEYVRFSADASWNAPNGGESAVAVATRALRVIEEIKERFHDGNVLIVSHKATIRVILCSLLGIDVGRFRYRLATPVGSVSMVEFTHEGFLLHMLADRAHLDEHLRSLPGT